MMLKQSFKFLFCVSFVCSQLLSAQTVGDKKRALVDVQDFSISEDLDHSQYREHLKNIQNQLQEIYKEAEALRLNTADEAAYKELVMQAKALKHKAMRLKTQWQQLNASKEDGESEAIWHLPNVSLMQLVMDFGSQDYIYIVPQELSDRQVSVVSSFSIPRETWPEMLDLVLAQQGIGIRQINPFCRELYIVDEGAVGFQHITDKREDLWLLPEGDHVCFVVDSEQIDVRSFAKNLERFVNPKLTQLKPLGNKLAIISTVSNLRQLMKVYDFLLSSQTSRQFKIIRLSKLTSEEMQRMLEVVFSQEASSSSKSSKSKSAALKKSEDSVDQIGLQVFPIQQEGISGLFIAGSKHEVQRAEELIRELESQIEEASNRKLYWYTCRHADPQDVGKLIAQVYRLLTGQGRVEGMDTSTAEGISSGKEMQPGNVAPLAVDPAFVKAGTSSGDSGESEQLGNIVVDPKSGALIMVVEPQILPKLKELIARLDTPKKMVKIDFLLFEKKLTDTNHFGMNLLKLGTNASNLNQAGMDYSVYTLHNTTGLDTGIMNFFLSRKNGSGPAFDVAYNLMLSQENIQINANPSVIAVNGTSSTINLVDELSVNTGQVEIDTTSTTRLKDSYTRAQFGININVTPNIHFSDEENPERSVTLETDINFDTTRSNVDNRPNVSRRNIKNTVRVLDGQTVVLGGLKEKDIEDTQEQLPFLGEIPGFGKLFSYTKMIDRTTEMFIFITPHIIDDPETDIAKVQKKEMQWRPGDIPEYLDRYKESTEKRRNKFFANSLKALFGRFETPNVIPDEMYQGEYDGRE